MMLTGHRILLVMAVAFVAVSCFRPESGEEFVRIDQSEGGVYPFTLALDDSLATYDISFYTKSSVDPELSDIPLFVVWTSPSGSFFEETVHMRPAGPEGARELYRSGVAPYETGEWKLDIRPVIVPEGFCGIGVICKHNN